MEIYHLSISQLAGCLTCFLIDLLRPGIIMFTIKEENCDQITKLLIID